MKQEGTDVSPQGISRRQFFDRLTTVIQGLFVASFTFSTRLLAKSVNQLPVEKLKALIADRVISRADSNYEVVRQSSVWQMIKPDQFPSLIVQAKSVNDVIETVKVRQGKQQKNISALWGAQLLFIISTR